MLKQRTTYRTSTAKHFSKALLVCLVVFVAQSAYAQFQLQVTVPADSLTATLPLFGTVNATVNWGGAGTTATETTYTTTGSQSYTYTNAGTYIISVTGTLTQFGNGATGYTNADKITKMISFGSVGLTNLSGAFYNATRLDSVPATLPSSVTDLSYMFYGATSFNCANDTGWNVGKVTNMTSMFQNASAFNQNLSGWCVSRIASAPTDFATGATAWTLAKPVWGICSSQFQLKVTVVSGSMTATLPLRGTVNATVYWGGSGTTAIEQTYTSAGDYSFTYSSAGTYIISISGTVTQFGRNNYAYTNADKITQVVSWGNVGLTSLSGAFSGATNLTFVPATLPSTVTSTYFMFYNATSFNSANVTGWDVSNVTNMDYMFCDASSFNQNIGNWNVSNVTTMGSMFSNDTAFNQSLNNWNVGNVTKMADMFVGARAFNQDISNWNVGKVTDMQGMFSYASSFNQDIGSWDVSKVTTMENMFYGAHAFNKYIGSWNVGNVTNMRYMFKSTMAFNQNISSWNVGKVALMDEMFYLASAFNQDLSGWCVSRIVSVPYRFSSGSTWTLPKPIWGICSSQFQLKVVTGGGSVTLPLYGTVNATVYWGGAGTTAIEQTYTSAGNKTYTYTSAGTYIISISGTVTKFGNGYLAYSNASSIKKMISFGNLGLTSLSGAFNGATSLDSVPVTLPSTVTDLSFMFKGATSFNSANDSLWDVSNVTDMSNMFYGATAFNRNIGAWDVGNVTNMSNMFYGSSAFNQNIGNWPIRRVNTMAGMFAGVTLSDTNYSALLTAWDSYSDTVRTVSAFASGGTSATTVTTSTPHYFAAGDTVMISGTTNYNGRWKVTAVSSTTQYTIAKTYVAETPSVSSTVVLARIRYVTFSGGNSKYFSSATTARQHLINTLYWTITDGGSLPDQTNFYKPEMIFSGSKFGVVTEYTLAGMAHPFAGNVTLSVASGPGTLSGTTTAAAVNGIAGFTGLSLSTAGTYTLQASSSALTSISNSFTVFNYTAGGSGDGHAGYGIASYGLDGVPVFQWSGLTSDWFTGSNWSRGATPSASVIAERILIPPVATLPVISGTTANNLTLSSELIVKDQATLTLNSGPVLTLSADSRISTLGTTGRLVITSGASFLNYSTSSPRIEAQRTITGSKGWRLLSGPVKTTYSDLLSGFVSQGFTGATHATLQPNFLWFDETDAGTTLQGWRKPAQVSDSTTTGRGYFLYVFNGAGKPSPLTGNYADQLPITMNVIGNEPAITASGINFNVTRTFRQLTPAYTPGNAAGFIDVNLQDQGWNLISNPTTSTINWNASSGWTKTNIGNSIYVWDPSASSGNGAYLTWNGSVGDLGSGLITPFQSFWIKADSLPVLKMTNSVKTVGGTFRKVSTPDSAESFPAISLRLRSGDLLCDKFITFTPSGKIGFDDLDAYSLVPLTDTYVTLFSQSADGQPSMKIQNLPLSGYEVPLIFPLFAGGFNSSAAINGIFTLNWTFNGTVPDGWKILLVDDATKKTYPLTEAGNMEFSFATPASLYDRQASSVGMAKSEPGSLFDMPAFERKIESPSNDVQHIAARRTAPENVKKMSKTTSAPVPELISAQTVATEREFNQTYDGGSVTTLSAGDSVLPTAVMVNPYPRVQRVMQKSSGTSLSKTSADENRFRIAVLPGREWDIEGYIPRTPEIHQNYPNPFNPATSIKFSVPKQTRVRLEVFNVLGQRVTMLADQEFQAGFHTVTWNARGVASGMYLCRFAADKQVKTIKMILLK